MQADRQRAVSGAIAPARGGRSYAVSGTSSPELASSGASRADGQVASSNGGSSYPQPGPSVSNLTVIGPSTTVSATRAATKGRSGDGMAPPPAAVSSTAGSCRNRTSLASG